MLDRLISALAAIGMAFLVWLYARNRDLETLDNIPIPVRVRLTERDAAQYLLDVNGPSLIQASFTGPPSRVRELRGMLQRGELVADLTVSVPAEWRSENRVLDSVRVTAADLHPPPGVRALVVEGQNQIPVTLRRISEKRLPVKLDHSLHDRLLNCQIEPATVLVRGPQDVLDRATALPTKLYTLPATSPGSALQEVVLRGTVGLVSELERQPVQTVPVGVTIRMTLRPPRRLYDVQVPVNFLLPANLNVRPQWMRPEGQAGRITLKVTGPPVAELPTITAYVDLTRPAFQSERDISQVFYSDEPIKIQLPPDFQLAQDPPPSGPFLLVPLAPTEPGRLPFLGGITPP